MNTEKLIKELEYRFGAVPVESKEEQYQYLNERETLEQECSWNFNAFIKYYQLIKRYGLEEKCLISLAWKIEHLLSKEDIIELRKSNFFKLFEKEKMIANAFIRRELKD